jgi:hypothetical protein
MSSRTAAGYLIPGPKGPERVKRIKEIMLNFTVGKLKGQFELR